MNEPLWVSAEDAIDINLEQVAMTGEIHFVRDRPALDSAVMAPRNDWHYVSGDLVRGFSKLVFSLAKAHAFEQGNKRTAFHAAAEFLAENGATFTPPDNEFWGEKMVDLITDRITVDEFEDMFRIFIV